MRCCAGGLGLGFGVDWMRRGSGGWRRQAMASGEDAEVGATEGDGPALAFDVSWRDALHVPMGVIPTPPERSTRGRSSSSCASSRKKSPHGTATCSVCPAATVSWMYSETCPAGAPCFDAGTRLTVMRRWSKPGAELNE